MRNNVKNALRRTLCLLIAVVMLAAMCSCASDSGTLLTLGDYSLSLNVYEMLISRMKGTLEYYYSANVNSANYWNTVVSADGATYKTYKDYYGNAMLKSAYRYIESEYIFDKMGLELPADKLAAVDKKMASVTEAAGSVNTLNSVLASYGMNRDLLEKLYITEAKIGYLRDTLYGSDASLIPEDVREDYFNKNYVCYRQVFLATYYFVLRTDEEGNTIYFSSDGKKAYDKVNGKTQKDEFGKNFTDSDGNDIYYSDDGSIAYDKINGKPGYETTADGSAVTKDYSGDKLAAIKARAEETLAMVSGMNEERFTGLCAEFSESDSVDRIYQRTDENYYESQLSSTAYMDEISKKLTQIQVGESAIVKSDSGYHIIYKCQPEEKAYDNDEYKDSFKSFYSDLIESLFIAECAKYDTDVVLNKAVLESARPMQEIGSNRIY